MAGDSLLLESVVNQLQVFEDILVVERYELQILWDVQAKVVCLTHQSRAPKADDFLDHDSPIFRILSFLSDYLYDPVLCDINILDVHGINLVLYTDSLALYLQLS